jgi:putative polysaccharide biosynthesis protein
MSMYSGEPGALQKFAELYRVTRERSREGHLSVARQWAEMSWLKLRHGIGPAYYQVATFWRREIPFADKRRHLGMDEYSKRLEALNPLGYRKLSQNKIAEKAILQLFNVPTPRFMGVVHPVSGRTASGEPLRSAADLARLLHETRAERLCFKQVEGWGGSGFRAASIAKQNGTCRLRPMFESDPLSLEDYLAQLLDESADGWVIEEYLDQHPSMQAFNPTSVNTMRMWVLQPNGSEPSCLGAYLRIGRGGALVDNQSSGGIIARIDPESGVLGAATDGLVAHHVFDVHPDHGAAIRGQKIPYWQEARALGASTLLLFPNVRFAGFDIAIGPSGPVVIELNVLPDLQGAAEMGLPLREVLRS